MPAMLKDLATGRSYDLGDFCLVGRSEGATLRLSDASISRQHASIRREETGYWVVDLDSANGTFVNDAALAASRRLAHGDRLQFGGLVMVFEEAADTGKGEEALLHARTEIAPRKPQPLRAAPLTLLVADLKGYTELSRRLSSGQIADLLREWYAGCETVLRAQGATIDKFIGDCVFAYWHGREPLLRRGALAAAERLRTLRSSGGVALDCRIGLHVGDVAVGAMGKGVNTALGDAVNMAFRLEELTRAADEPILVSAAFLADWPASERLFASRGRHRIKGYADAIEVFAPVDRESQPPFG